ncbi:hypothetical protein F5B21DRAFT_496178 [Xylaria acuta]|nr:hypothetical protein F5B21DRAFT_496178 [Xylaria acuta]
MMKWRRTCMKRPSLFPWSLSRSFADGPTLSRSHQPCVQGSIPTTARGPILASASSPCSLYATHCATGCEMTQLI